MELLAQLFGPYQWIPVAIVALFVVRPAFVGALSQRWERWWG